MDHPIKSPKKLIEVALPLDDINREAAREKSIRHGHPSTLHLWWARRPLAAARAVIFAQLVNDPSWKWEMDHAGEVPPSHLKASWASSRKRLFALLSELVKWENTTNEDLLTKARAEIRKSWRETCEINKDHPDAATLFNPDKMPGLHDPFAGGGAIPLEAQRLGLEAFASDLNPVAVLINKAMIEIPPKFAGRPPVHPKARQEGKLMTWSGAQGLAEDVRRYGVWMRDEVEKHVGHLYPKVEVTDELAAGRPDLNGMVGKKLTVIAWLWARTVESPNPATNGVHVPLVSTFVLSSKSNKETYAEPVVRDGAYRFEIRLGTAPDVLKSGTKVGRGNFRCVVSGAPISADYVRSQGKAGGLRFRLMAIVADGPDGRCYLNPTKEQEAVALEAAPPWQPDVEFFQQALGFRIGNYGLERWSDVFTPRQTTTLEAFCHQLPLVRNRVLRDAKEAEPNGNGDPLSPHGGDGQSYADAVCVYLGLSISRLANRSSALCFWDTKGENIQQVFARQALTMIFDTAEGNPFSSSTGNFVGQMEYLARVVDHALPAGPPAVVTQDAAQQQRISQNKVVCTDPPYYDNIGYADLSDFFYVWLRRALRPVLPELFSAIAAPKAEELVATPHRHGGRDAAETFFLAGMGETFRNIASQAHPAAATAIFYAFKQSETQADSGTSSTGWETFLQAVLDAGLAVSGTWPVRTEYTSNLKTKRNALASSVVLVCRRRPDSAAVASRRQFIRELNSVLPEALDEMTMGAGEERSPVAPVDLSQAIIGPGMAVFSKYAAVLEADGTPMSVKTALQLINRFLAEDDFDADTQFCLRWFEQHGWDEGHYGEADVLARAKATSVGGVVDAGVAFSGSGKVRLRRWSEYPADWDPTKDKRLPVWEGLHQLIRAFKSEGDSGSGKLLGAIKDKTEAVRQLAYRLYTLCERRGWAEDARAYNELVTSWSAIETVANAVPDPVKQLDLDLGGNQ